MRSEEAFLGAAGSGGVGPQFPGRSLRRFPAVWVWLVLWGVAGWISAPAALGGDGPACYRVVRAAAPPVLDGRLDDACWRHACRITGFHPLGTVAGAGRGLPATTAFITYDSGALDIGFECVEPLAAGLKAPTRPHDGRTWEDNGVEIFLNPGGDRRRYVQIAVNLAGSIMDAIANEPGAPIDMSWETGARAAVKIGRGRWTMEVRAPFSGLPLARPRGPWTFHLARNRAAAGQHLTCLRAPVHGYHEVAKFARLEGIDVTASHPVCVSSIAVGSLAQGINLCRVGLKNWGRAALNVAAAAGVAGTGRMGRKTLSLPGGAAEEIVLPWPLSAADAGRRFVLEVRAGSDQRWMFRRELKIPAAPPVLGAPACRVFLFRQDRFVTVRLPVRLAAGSLRGASLRLNWEARDPRGELLGTGFTTVTGRTAVIRLYWLRWTPGWRRLALTLKQGDRVLARTSLDLRFVESPWSE